MNKLKEFWGAIKQMFTVKHGFEYGVMKEFQLRDGEVQYNITGIHKIKDYATKYLQVHHTLKSKVIEPLLRIADTFFDHYKIKKVPRKNYNYLLVAFEEAFDDTERDYFKCYLNNSQLAGKKTKEITKLMKADLTCKKLRSLKDWAMTIVQMDSSFREFFNMLMIRLHIALCKVFEDTHPTINHLIYRNKSVNDVEYFQLFEKVKRWRDLQKHDMRES